MDLGGNESSRFFHGAQIFLRRLDAGCWHGVNEPQSNFLYYHKASWPWRCDAGDLVAVHRQNGLLGDEKPNKARVTYGQALRGRAVDLLKYRSVSEVIRVILAR